jgi:Rap1a immunity proteins
MARFFVFAATSIFLICGGSAGADDAANVGTLLRICAATDGLSGIWCTEYIAGVGEMMFENGFVKYAHLEDAAMASEQAACSSDSFISHGAMKQAFMNWANQHPEHWNIIQSFGVMVAIRTTWPCAPEQLLRR